mmetsp:Transcript_46528/g.132688  ORF Transcript_46528/g.132688 Transcript_46528/m.132688 type:complete len:585 (+) Transcript_46528:1480-3234(+)
MLAARPDVLDSKGTVAHYGDACALHPLIVGILVAHAVANLPIEFILAGVLEPPVEAHAARIVVHDGAFCREGLRTLLQRVDRELVVPVRLILASHNVHGRDVGLQLAVWQNTVLFACILEVPEHLLLARVEVPVHGPAATLRRQGILGAKPHVERAELCLDLGVPVCGRDPAVAPDLVIAVKEHNVIVACSGVLHGCLDAVVAAANDGDGVRPLVRGRSEGLQALHCHCAAHGVGVCLHAHLRAARHLKHEVAGLRACDLREHGLDVCHLCALFDGKLDRVGGALDGHRCLDEVLASLGMLVNLGIILSPEHQEIALEGVVARVPLVVSNLDVCQPRLQGCCALVARELALPDLRAVAAHELLRVRLELRLALVREEALVRRGPVDHHDRRRLQSVFPTQLVRKRCHDLRAHLVTDERKGRSLELLARRVFLEGRLHSLIRIRLQVVQAAAGILICARTMARQLIDDDLQPRRRLGRQLGPVSVALARAVEEERPEADLAVDLLRGQVLPQGGVQEVIARQPTAAGDLRQVALRLVCAGLQHVAARGQCGTTGEAFASLEPLSNNVVEVVKIHRGPRRTGRRGA